MIKINTGYLYVHINKTNGLKYIGITTQAKPQSRWKNGKAYEKNTNFWKDIQLYGWDGFEHYILFENIDKELLQHLEYRLIGYFLTKNPIYGYNQKKGTASDEDAVVRVAEEMFFNLIYDGYKFPGLFAHNRRVAWLEEQREGAPSKEEYESFMRTYNDLKDELVKIMKSNGSMHETMTKMKSIHEGNVKVIQELSNSLMELEHKIPWKAIFTSAIAGFVIGLLF